MVTKAKKALLASLAAFLCVMLTVFGLSMSVSLSETAKAADETTTEVAEVNGVKFATLAEAIAAAKDGETVKLLANATEDVGVDKNITLDLGGKTLTGTKTDKKASLTVVKGATATVKNGTIFGTENSYYTIQNNGTATFENLNATAGNTGASMIDNWGTLTINSGEYSGGLNVVKSEEDSKLTINGGKFTLDYSTNGYTGVIFAYGDTTITGGEFIQSLTTCGNWDHPQVVATGVVEGHTAITRVTGGSFTNAHSGEGIFRGVGKGTSDNFKVSGGTFNKVISADYCAEGFIPSTTKNADGMYGVKEGKYVAKIGSKKYETLADAIRLATKGKTVTLLDNISGNFEIASAKNITLDLNGFTLNGGTGTAKAAITNHGTLTITDSSAKKTGTIKRDDSGIVGETSYYVIRNLGTMTIEQANVINNSGSKGSSLIDNIGDEKKASLTIKNGHFEQQNFIAIKNDSFAELTVIGGEIVSKQSAIQNWCDARITGGKITGQIWTDAWQESSIGKTVIDGTVEFTGEIVMDVTNDSIKPELTINGGNLSVTNWRITKACAKLGGKPAVQGGTFTNAVPAEYCANGFIPTQNADGTYGVKEGAYVAEVNGVKYETLQAAFEAARVGTSKVVTLLADYTATEKGGSNPGVVYDITGVTFDLGGHKFSASNFAVVFAGSNGVIQNGEMICLNGSYALFIGDEIETKGFTASNLTLTGGINVYNATMVVLDNLTVNGTDYYAVWADENASITIESGTYTAGDVAVLSGAVGLSTINVTGGTFITNDKPLMGDSKATLQISGGTFSSEVNKDYLAKGYRLTKTGESYGVTAKYIESTHVSLGTALSFSYKLRVLNEGETIKNAKASYRTVRGNLVEIDMTLIDGYYVFDGITPQMLDRKISVNVYVGDTVVYDVVDYNILDYLQDLLNSNLGTKATVTKQLVADLAFYGKAAMKYVGYTTTVVDKFIADNGLTQSTGDITGVATSSGTEKVANVSVQFASQNKILIGVAESVFNDYSYTIKVNGTEIANELWQTDVVDGYRVYVSDGFAASYITDKDHYVEVEVLKNGASVQKVQCNVAGYCMKMAKNEKMGELATATYYYGVSAAKYAAIIKG